MKWKITTEAIITTCLAMMIMAGCGTTRQSITRQTATEDAQTNVYRTDTVLLHNTTSVRKSSRTEVIQKDTTVQIELPQIQIERETMDTTSIIDTPYFTSKATWSGGKLTHTLMTKPGASIKAKVRVTDTSLEQNTTTERTHSMKEVSKRDSTKTTAKTNTMTGIKAPAKKKHTKATNACGWLKRIAIAAALILLITTIAAALLYFNKGSGIFKRRS